MRKWPDKANTRGCRGFGGGSKPTWVGAKMKPRANRVRGHFGQKRHNTKEFPPIGGGKTRSKNQRVNQKQNSDRVLRRTKKRKKKGGLS